MSVELEWELYDIFDSGMFATPIYEHTSARRIVRYLLMKGIIHEEIAEAIEDSSVDLLMWLNRHGKHQIGEWVIAWINEMGEEFQRGELHKMDNLEEGGLSFDRNVFLRDLLNSDDEDDYNDHHSNSKQGTQPKRMGDGRSDSRITDLESIDSQAPTTSSGTSAATHLASTRQAAAIGANTGETSGTAPTDRLELQRLDSEETPPPLPPPRTFSSTPTTPAGTWARSYHRPSNHRPSNLDLTRRSLSSTEGLYEPPDSGHFSDLYTAIPPDRLLEAAAAEAGKVAGLNDNISTGSSINITVSNNNISDDSSTGSVVSRYNDNNKTQEVSTELAEIRCQLHSPRAPTALLETDSDESPTSRPSSPNFVASKCTCSIAHYSYINNQLAKNVDDVTIPDLPPLTAEEQPPTPSQDRLLFQDNQKYCDIYFCEGSSTSLATTTMMQYDFETLDRDGPGFVFIMTDTLANCLPWSSEYRYKIASSRQPDRCLLEFRSRNIEIDLIWQVKVKNHYKAVREIHDVLSKYNLHSNWFKCSLSLIMDTISRVIKRYQ